MLRAADMSTRGWYCEVQMKKIEKLDKKKVRLNTAKRKNNTGAGKMYEVVARKIRKSRKPKRFFRSRLLESRNGKCRLIWSKKPRR